MAGFRQPEIPRQQILLWEQQLDDAIPLDHEVRLFDQIIRSSFFKQTFLDWEKTYDLTEGQPPYHPLCLCSVYIYGMLHRLRSSRSLEGACYNRIDVQWLMSGQKPDYSTIANFVKNNQALLQRIYKDTLAIAAEAQLIKLEHVAYDGTKIGADAGKGSTHKKATIEAQLATLNARVEAEEREWEQNEQRENALFGSAGAEVPRENKSKPRRLAELLRKQELLTRALKNIQQRQEASTHSEEPKAIASTTDPDSRTMPSKEGGSRPNYNAHLGVDHAHGFIVAQGVSDDAEDNAQLVPMLEETRANTGQLPEKISADGNYHTGPNLAALEKMDVVAFIPAEAQTKTPQPKQTPPVNQPGAAVSLASRTPLAHDPFAALPQDSHHRITKQAFTFDPVADEYRCPMGQTLKFVGLSTVEKNSGERLRRAYHCSACHACPRANQCCVNPKTGRTVKRDQYDELRERHRQHMSAPEAKTQYDVRKQTVEPCFGHIKAVLGVRRFMHRGLEAVRTEWSTLCAVVNFKGLLAHWDVVERVVAGA